MARILIVDDERSMREFLDILLHKSGHEVTVALHAEAAFTLLERERFDLTITDINLGAGRPDGLAVLSRVKEKDPQTEVIVITAFATTENAVQAMKAGAHDYLIKPFKVDELNVVVQKALEKRALVLENVLLRSKLAAQHPDGIIGKSAAMRAVYQLVDKVAPTRTTVLITGESGTGKELVARAIHAQSRKTGPFVPVNCGAIPANLIESELFGHLKGAFTDAKEAKPGVFGAANGGTLFLDEIGELPLTSQVSLLRAIQEKRVRPVGATKDVEVDVRIIAATNRDLAADVKAGRFREDLFYRLDVVRIHVPPLRARPEDVPLLAQHFIVRTCAQLGRSPMRLTAEARQRLDAYAFPGNVRELENLIERAVTLAEGDEIGAAALPGPLRPSTSPVLELSEHFDLEARLGEIERGYLLAALDRAKGVKKDAAALLGITFRQFRHRWKKINNEGDDDEAE